MKDSFCALTCVDSSQRCKLLKVLALWDSSSHWLGSSEALMNILCTCSLSTVCCRAWNHLWELVIMQDFWATCCVHARHFLAFPKIALCRAALNIVMLLYSYCWTRLCHYCTSANCNTIWNASFCEFRNAVLATWACSRRCRVIPVCHVTPATSCPNLHAAAMHLGSFYCVFYHAW